VASYKVSKRREHGVELHGWQVTVNYGIFWDEDGRRHRPREVRHFRTKTEAEDYGQRRCELANAGRIVRPGRLTVRDLLRDWQERWLNTPGRRAPKTVEVYHQQIKTHLLPALGTVRLTALTPAVIDEALHARQRKHELSPATMRKLLSILSVACRWGARQGLLARNPVEDVDPPPLIRRKRLVLSPAQLLSLRDVSQEHSPDALYPFVLLAIALGLRREEILALRWRDVDLETGGVQVRRAIVMDDGEPSVAPTKTRAGERGGRPVVLPVSTRAALKAYRTRQREQRLAAESWDDHDLICCRPNGRPHVPNTMSSQLRRFGARHGFPGLGPHVLRRSWVTMLRSAGVDALLVSGAAGHASIRTTDDIYVEVTDAARERLADDVERLLSSDSAERCQQSANIEGADGDDAGESAGKK